MDILQKNERGYSCNQAQLESEHINYLSAQEYLLKFYQGNLLKFQYANKSINLNSDYSIFNLNLLYFAAFALILSFSIFFLLTSENANAVEPKSIYFGEEINISDNSGISELPQVTAEGNNVYVVWQDNSSGNYDVYFAHSPDNGKNFKSIINLSKNNGTSELPQVTAEGNNVYVVWQDNSSGNYDVYFKPSSSDGTKFKSTRNLSKNNGTSQHPKIASHNDVFYVVWMDDSNGKQNIFSKNGRIENLSNSIEFGSLRKIRGIGDASKPEIFAGENFVHTIWASSSEINSVINIYPVSFFDDSKDAVKLTKSALKGNILDLRISGYSINAYCVWENKDVLNGDIFFKRLSTDLIN